MANLRVVYNNAADRATIAASTTAGTLVPANLQTDYKSEVWRSTALSSTLTFTWATSEQMSMVALCFATLTSAATFRVKGFTLVGDVSPAYDSGVVQACPGVDLSNLQWGGTPLGANAYAYGGGAYGVVYFPLGNFQKLTVDIVDSNTLNYIEASRAVIGTYWSPTFNAEVGATITLNDNSRQERTDAGDLRVDRGTVSKTLNFDLNYLTKADRDQLYNILRGNGLFKSTFISLLPADATDLTGEQVFQVYGKLSKQGSIKYQLTTMFSSQIEIEEI